MRITICANLVLCFAGKSVYKRERETEKDGTNESTRN